MTHNELPKYIERASYETRVGVRPDAVPIQRPLFRPRPSVPEELYKPEDRIMNDDDMLRMRTAFDYTDDPVPSYFGNPEAQRRILIDEHAADRLLLEDRELYDKLVEAEVSRRLGGRACFPEYEA